jgi:abequosyltransferase
MNIRLSICIPIYNCAEFVGQALDSILPQVKEGVEVVVYDGGSTDDTAISMGYYVKAWSNLQYHRASERGGIDADMAKCVGFAKGEYCWLFSGDDVMRPGAIERALEWAKRGHDVFICKHTVCNIDMIVSRELPVLQPDQVFTANLAKSNERVEWFKRAATTEAFFSFISGLIVRREKWQSGELPEAFNKSCWGHVARFFGLASTELTVCYVAEVWLDQRGDNDSFADKGVVNRFKLAIEGYHRLADSYFGRESIEAFHIRRVIRNEFKLSAFLFAKMQCKKHPDIEDKLLLDRLVQMTLRDRSIAGFFTRCGYLFIPYRLYVTARFVYRAFKSYLRKYKHAKA